MFVKGPDTPGDFLSYDRGDGVVRDTSTGHSIQCRPTKRFSQCVSRAHVACGRAAEVAWCVRALICTVELTVSMSAIDALLLCRGLIVSSIKCKGLSFL